MAAVKEPLQPAEGLRSVGFLLSQLGFVVSREFRRRLAPLHLEPRHFLVLRLVAADEGRSQQALAEALHIPASRMVAIVDSLAERGLLERRADPSDRRVRLLHLTAAGRQLLDAALRIALEYEEEIVAHLGGDARRGELVSLLGRLAEALGLHPQVHPVLADPGTELPCAPPPEGCDLEVSR